MDLKTALELMAGELVAFVGAGGKTTAAWRLLRKLADAGDPVVFTTTTRIFEPQEKIVPLLLTSQPDAAEIDRRLAEYPALVLAAARGEPGDPQQAARSVYPAGPTKLIGLQPHVLDELSRQLPGTTWLVEADGARGRLLKAPADYEPVIPSTARRVVVVAGLGAIGAPLDERTVHRPQIAARLLGVPSGTTITPELYLALINHPAGGLKGIPPLAEVAILLTRWEPTQWKERPWCILVETLARRLLSNPRIGRVVHADLSSPTLPVKTWPQRSAADSPTRSIADSPTR